MEHDPLLPTATDEGGHSLVFYLHPELARLDEMIEVLVAHGADFNARNTAGKTLLDRALARLDRVRRRAPCAWCRTAAEVTGAS
jgi:ankyrin repeat protein